MIHKKAAFQLSVEFIVIIILALFFIALGISFIKSSIEKSQIRLEEAIVVGAPKPNVEIVSPQNNQIFQVGDTVSFVPFVYSLKSEIKGYFWDFDGDGSIDSRKEEDEFIYWEIGDYNVTLKVLNDLGGVGTASAIVRVFTRNEKDSDRYTGNPAFFIPSIPSGNPVIKVANWQEILKAIPLTRWYDKDGDHIYNFVAIAKQSDQPDVTWSDIKVKLDDFSEDDGVVDTVVVFDIDLSEGEVLQAANDGYTVVEESTSDMENYFSYWEDDYDNVVLISSDNFDGALIGSLFAAYSNSPLVFIEDLGLGLVGEYSDYDDRLVGRKVYVIDELPDNVRKHYFGCSQGSEECGGESWGALITDSVFYDSEVDLRDGEVNRILELKSKIFLKE